MAEARKVLQLQLSYEQSTGLLTLEFPDDNHGHSYAQSYWSTLRGRPGFSTLFEVSGNEKKILIKPVNNLDIGILRLVEDGGVYRFEMVSKDCAKALDDFLLLPTPEEEDSQLRSEWVMVSGRSSFNRAYYRISPADYPSYSGRMPQYIPAHVLAAKQTRKREYFWKKWGRGKRK